MQLKKIMFAAGFLIATSMVVAEPTAKPVDLSKLYSIYEKSSYSSLELMDSARQVLISGFVLSASESFNGTSILKVGARANSPELARLAAADIVQENKLKTLQAGDKFKAVCDLAFTSGAQYMSFQKCIFK